MLGAFVHFEGGSREAVGLKRERNFACYFNVFWIIEEFSVEPSNPLSRRRIRTVEVQWGNFGRGAAGEQADQRDRRWETAELVDV